ncbi:cAMP-dependent protein kinase catalytic subunit beta-like [Homalodisca vitripennis]|uniref:cAMP-dependent protein kinase catalytic subunit beta-like n=1 Tax=Homalodisca vitripennis TaxID=197043 RepID=UPI001EECBD2B|nr:cAMP-dependent protein kinase catalytic subunit beta-like [Homalodisca vitripennis]KAG8246997.1 hypothetical protein J6590_071856 [Homalodisca vitripennis]
MRYSDFGPLEITSYDSFLNLGKTRFNAKLNEKMEWKEKLDDFEHIEILGRGTFGKVVLVKNKRSQKHKFQAMKIIEKKILVDKKQVQNTLTEKTILQCACHPFMTTLDFAFQDNSYIYFIMPHIPGGDLYTHMRKFGKFDEAQAQFYAAQVILAVEFLHYLNFIYRDIKLENILIDHTGYLKLTDFGFCKKLEKGRTYTLCGTPEYIAPEVLLHKGYGLSADWWSVGILIFEMNAGFTPFYSRNVVKLYNKILGCRFKIPFFFSSDLKDLVTQFLKGDITQRLGNMKGGVDSIKRHKWFNTMNWLSLLSRKLVSPYKPKFVMSTSVSAADIKDILELSVSGQNEYKDIFDGFA